MATDLFPTLSGSILVNPVNGLTGSPVSDVGSVCSTVVAEVAFVISVVSVCDAVIWAVVSSARVSFPLFLSEQETEDAIISVTIRRTVSAFDRTDD